MGEIGATQIWNSITHYKYALLQKQVTMEERFIQEVRLAGTVLTESKFPPRNRRNTFFLLMQAKSFLHQCLMVGVLHYIQRLQPDVSSSSILI